VVPAAPERLGRQTVIDTDGLRRHLTQHRIRAGLSQEQVADLMGVTQPTVSGLERGRYKTLDLVMVDRWASAVGLTFTWALMEYRVPGRPRARRTR
jgi:transcriptional regulator with XRE-family HTH domain